MDSRTNGVPKALRPLPKEAGPPQGQLRDRRMVSGDGGLGTYVALATHPHSFLRGCYQYLLSLALHACLLSCSGPHRK